MRNIENLAPAAMSIALIPFLAGCCGLLTCRHGSPSQYGPQGSFVDESPELGSGACNNDACGIGSCDAGSCDLGDCGACVSGTACFGAGRPGLARPEVAELPPEPQGPIGRFHAVPTQDVFEASAKMSMNPSRPALILNEPRTLNEPPTLNRPQMAPTETLPPPNDSAANGSAANHKGENSIRDGRLRDGRSVLVGSNSRSRPVERGTATNRRAPRNASGPGPLRPARRSTIALGIPSPREFQNEQRERQAQTQEARGVPALEDADFIFPVEVEPLETSESSKVERPSENDESARSGASSPRGLPEFDTNWTEAHETASGALSIKSPSESPPKKPSQWRPVASK